MDYYSITPVGPQQAELFGLPSQKNKIKIVEMVYKIFAENASVKRNEFLPWDRDKVRRCKPELIISAAKSHIRSDSLQLRELSKNSACCLINMKV